MEEEDKQRNMSNWDKKPVGTIEQQKLEAKPVKILAYKDEVVVFKKGGEGKKVVFQCKHPDMQDSIEISGCKTINGNKIEMQGLWIKLDKDGNIQKGSALSSLVAFYGAKTVSEMVDKTVRTAMDDKGYLCLQSF
jgi:hypothetical protein